MITFPPIKRLSHCNHNNNKFNDCLSGNCQRVVKRGGGGDEKEDVEEEKKENVQDKEGERKDEEKVGKN